MAIEKPAAWTGASGAEYTFHVFGPEPDVPSRPGNYVYAKRNAEGAWVPIYMGHGDLATCCTDSTVLRCIASKGSTHLHLRLNCLESDRESELQDLLAHYANAYAPAGCHARPGDSLGDSRGEAGPTRKPRARQASTKKAVGKTVAGKTAVGKTKTPAKAAPAKKTPVNKTPAKKASGPAKARSVRAKTPRPRSK